LRSSAAHPATNAKVSSKNRQINAKNNMSTASPMTELQRQLKRKGAN
jgi:hypothetical protein